jgi:hypothetical protein
MRGILGYKKIERNDKNKSVQFLATLYKKIDPPHHWYNKKIVPAEPKMIPATKTVPEEQPTEKKHTNNKNHHKTNRSKLGSR